MNAEPVTRDELDNRFQSLQEALMATQAEVDALTLVVQTIQASVTDAQAAIQSQFDALQQQLTADAQVDLTGLQSAVTDLQPAVSALGSLQPQTPAPVSADPVSAADPHPDVPAIDPSVPADSTPEPAAAINESAVAAPASTVYTFAGDTSLIDTGVWPASGFETAADPPEPLYYFTGDNGAGEANGDGLSGGQWKKYTGPVQPVPTT